MVFDVLWSEDDGDTAAPRREFWCKMCVTRLGLDADLVVPPSLVTAMGGALSVDIFSVVKVRTRRSSVRISLLEETSDCICKEPPRR